jgi:membrane protein DedA with SNARE-associated domain
MFERLFPYFQNPQIEALEDTIRTFVVHQAVIAPFILLFIEESGIPLPIPGDVYLAFTGYQVSKGTVPYWGAFLMLLIAVLAGSSILYFISAKWGTLLVDRLGIYLHLNQKKLAEVEKDFKKYGVFLIIFGRHIPGFRIPITVFSGISGVPYPTFIMSTFISVVFWIAFYLALGERVGKNVMKHFHATPAYFLLISIPFLFFIGSIVYVKLNDAKKNKGKSV